MTQQAATKRRSLGLAGSHPQPPLASELTITLKNQACLLNQQKTIFFFLCVVSFRVNSPHIRKICKRHAREGQQYVSGGREGEVGYIRVNQT